MCQLWSAHGPTAFPPHRILVLASPNIYPDLYNSPVPLNMVPVYWFEGYQTYICTVLSIYRVPS